MKMGQAFLLDPFAAILAPWHHGRSFHYRHTNSPPDRHWFDFDQGEAAETGFFFLRASLPVPPEAGSRPALRLAGHSVRAGRLF